MIDQTALEAGQAIAVAVGAGALEGVSDDLRSRVNNLLGLFRPHLEGKDDVLSDVNVQSRRPSEVNATVLAEQLAQTDVVNDSRIVEEAREIIERARQQGIHAEGAGSVVAESIHQTATSGGANYTGGTHTNTVNNIQGHSNKAVADWDVQWAEGDAYTLTKQTVGAAYDVEFTFPANFIIKGDDLHEPTWQEAESRRFVAGVDWSGDRYFSVRYRSEREGEILEKRLLLPPRPKKR